MTEQQNTPIRQADPKDVEKNKVMAVLAYFIFFLPFLTEAKDSPFAKFHANQGFVLFLFSVIGQIIGSIIPVVGWFLIIPLVWIAAIIFVVLGIMNASNGKMKELPIIGQYHILDK